MVNSIAEQSKVFHRSGKMDNPVWQRLASLSETELRLNVIIPILERTPGTSQVTDVHGMNERGLDVIFFAADGIRRTCYGVQLKRGDIAGGGSKDRTVSQIIDQLNLATRFKHPVAIQPAGEYRIEHFIVATNGRISGTAREEIGRRVDSIPVDFWDLSEIVRRANDVLPDLVHTADAQVLSYLKFVQAKSETLDALDQISGVALRNLSDVFVEPRLRRRFDTTLADARGGTGTRHSHTINALDLSTADHNSVIVGEQNEGKTAILRMIAIRRCELLIRGDTSLDDAAQIPVIVRALQIINRGSLRHAMAEVLKSGGAHKRAEDVMDGSLEQYYLLVDGFSELSSEDAKRACAKLLEELASAAKIRILVTSRPDDLLRPSYFNSFHHYTIVDFDQKQTRTLVHRWTKGMVEVADVAEKMIDRVRDALQLPGSPIPAIIGVMLYEKENKYITNTAEAVDRYMVIRLGRYSQEMGLRMEVEWRRKEDLLAVVAFTMVEQELDTIPVADAIALMDGLYGVWGEIPNSSVAIAELITAGVLDRVDDRLSFYRTAFRDFFAAKHILNQHSDFDEFFARKLYDRRWGQALVFAAGLRRHNSDLLIKLNTLVQTERTQLTVASSEDYLYGAYLLGRILSNSDAADQASRIEVLRTSVQAASDSAAELAREAQRQFGNIGQVVALVGVEHTMFVTVGVPWLAQQLRALVYDSAVAEEERYLVTSVYAHLACDDWMDVLEDAIRNAKSARVIAALMILVHILNGQRRLEGPAARKWSEVRKQLDKKRKQFQNTIDRMLEIKDPVLALERERIRRLQNRSKA